MCYRVGMMSTMLVSLVFGAAVVALYRIVERAERKAKIIKQVPFGSQCRIAPAGLANIERLPAHQPDWFR
jgi:hypothetical protein